MNNLFEVGDLVKLNYSEHIGMVIGDSDRSLSEELQVHVYRIKWAVGEPYTWERLYNLILVAGVNNEKRI